MSLKKGIYLEWLKPLQDPELRMSLVDLGLIYEIEENAPGSLDVKMTLTTPTCPAAEGMRAMVRDRLLEHPEVETAEVELVFEPKWSAAEMASEECKEAMGVW